MSRDRRADPDCPHCHGSGTVFENEKYDEAGDYWCNFVDCICIPINPISQELREVLADALRKAVTP